MSLRFTISEPMLDCGASGCELRGQLSHVHLTLGGEAFVALTSMTARELGRLSEVAAERIDERTEAMHAGLGLGASTPCDICGRWNYHLRGCGNA